MLEVGGRNSEAGRRGGANRAAVQPYWSHEKAAERKNVWGGGHGVYASHRQTRIGPHTESPQPEILRPKVKRNPIALNIPLLLMTYMWCPRSRDEKNISHCKTRGLIF